MQNSFAAKQNEWKMGCWGGGGGVICVCLYACACMCLYTFVHLTKNCTGACASLYV